MRLDFLLQENLDPKVYNLAGEPYSILMIAQQNIKFIGRVPDPELLFSDYKLMAPIYERNFLRWIPNLPGASILDFGCGYGTFLSFLLSRGIGNVLGFDPDPRCEKFCRESVLPEVVGGDSLEFLRTRVGCCDAIFCLSVAEYFERDRVVEWFSLLAGALKPNGLLVITVPNAAPLTGSMDYIQDPFMRSLFTDISLLDICERAGLEVVHLGPVELPAKGWGRWGWLAAQGAWFMLLKFVYLLERGRGGRNPRHFCANLLLVVKKPL